MEVENQIFTKRFMMLFTANLTVFVVFYAMLTIFPLYVVQTLNGTQDEAGLLVTVFMVSAIIVRPFSGKLLDMYGKKTLLVVGAIFYLACTFLYALIDSLTLLMIIRFLQGATFSIVTTGCMALAADTIPIKRRGVGLGYYMMSSNLAIVLGPLVGLFLLQYVSFTMIFVVLGIIMAVGVAASLSVNVSDLPAPDKNMKFTFKLGDLFERKALPLSFMALALAITYTTILSFMSLYAEEKNLLQAATYFYIVFAIAMMLIRPYAGKLFDVKGPKAIILPAMLLYAVGLVIMSLITTPMGLILSAITIGIGYGTVSAALQSQALQTTPPQRSSYVTATYFTMFDTGIAIGSYLFGVIILYTQFSFIYQLAAAMVIVLLAVYMWYMRNK